MGSSSKLSAMLYSNLSGMLTLPANFYVPLAVPSAGSIANFLLLLITGLLSYVAVVAFYRIYLHPLANVPGPTLAKITSLYTTYYAYRGDRFLNFYRLHKKYGPVVRFGPNHVSFNSATAMQQIYGHGSGGRHFRKSDFYKAFPAVKGVHNTHNAIDKTEHGRKRRVLAHAFGEKALNAMETDGVLRHVKEFLGIIDKSVDEKRAVDIGEASNWLSFDVMGELCFGKSFGMLVGEGQRFVSKMIEMAATNHYICGNFLIFHTMKLSKFLFPEIAKTRWRFILHSRECANERMKLHEAGLDAHKRDFFHYLLNAEDSETGSKFSKLELWGEANVLMIAGSDTTATALSATLFYLVKHPEIVAELRKELRSKFTDIEDIAMAKGPALGQCQLLQACIKEAMRLAPPVPGVLPRECVSDNIKIDGTAIPRGTVVGVPTWTIHHNPQYFPDPFTFNPYRWLSEDKSLCEQNAYAPFSIGSRACIGREMAMGELRVTIGRLVYGWDFKEIPTEGKGELWHKGFKGGEGKEPEFRLVDGFTSRKEGPVLKFERLLV